VVTRLRPTVTGSCCQAHESTSCEFLPHRQFSRLMPRLVILVLILCLAACGNVGEPLPPLIQIPVAVSDLAVTQTGRSVKLSWTLPKLNTDGSAATTLSAIEIYRLVPQQPQTQGLGAKLLLESSPWKTILKDDLNQYSQGNKLLVVDAFADLQPETLFQGEFHYAVRAINNKRQGAGLSNAVSVRILPLPHPPSDLRIRSLSEQHIELGWETPSLNFDGSPVKATLHFNVYRGSTLQAAVSARLNQNSVPENHFRDESIELGKPYFYSVRAIVETPLGTLESDESELLAVTNADTYPPKTPAEVTAVSDGRAISLVWLPNAEADLAGYWVYRSGGDRKFQRLNDQLLTTASTIDKSVEKGQTYFYRVKAVDLKGNESEFSEEVSDTAE